MTCGIVLTHGKIPLVMKSLHAVRPHHCCTFCRSRSHFKQYANMFVWLWGSMLSWLRGRGKQHSSIFAAITSNDVAAVKAFLEENPSLVNERNSVKWTPLHQAASLGFKDVVDCLITAGASLTDMTPYQKTAAALARENNFFKLARHLEDLLTSARQQRIEQYESSNSPGKPDETPFEDYRTVHYTHEAESRAVVATLYAESTTIVTSAAVYTTPQLDVTPLSPAASAPPLESDPVLPPACGVLLRRALTAAIEWHSMDDEFASLQNEAAAAAQQWQAARDALQAREVYILDLCGRSESGEDLVSAVSSREQDHARLCQAAQGGLDAASRVAAKARTRLSLLHYLRGLLSAYMPSAAGAAVSSFPAAIKSALATGRPGVSESEMLSALSSLAAALPLEQCERAAESAERQMRLFEEESALAERRATACQRAPADYARLIELRAELMAAVEAYGVAARSAALARAMGGGDLTEVTQQEREAAVRPQAIGAEMHQLRQTLAQAAQDTNPELLPRLAELRRSDLAVDVDWMLSTRTLQEYTSLSEHSDVTCPAIATSYVAVYQDTAVRLRGYALRGESRKAYESDLRLLSRSRCDGVVPVVFAFIDNDCGYIHVPSYPQSLSLLLTAGALAADERAWRAQSLMTQLLQVLQVLHDRNVVHGALTPDCLWLDTAGRIVVDGLSTGPVNRRAAQGYLAPEVEGGDLPTARSDMYSFGCILHELALGRAAPAAGTFHQITSAACGGNDRLADLLDQLLSADPSLRPTAPAALRHEYFTVSVAEQWSREGVVLSSKQRLAPVQAHLARLPPPTGFISITINRNSLVRDTFTELQRRSVAEILRAQLSVRFENESGIGVGVKAEWLSLFFTRVCADESLFVRAPAVGASLVLPSPTADCARLVIVGALMLKAILERQPCAAPFSLIVFRFLLPRSKTVTPIATLSDLDSYDAEAGAHMQRLSLMSDSQFGSLGVSLADGTPLSRATVRRFVQEHTQSTLVGCRLQQLEALACGFDCVAAGVSEHMAQLRDTDLAELFGGQSIQSADRIVNALRFVCYPHGSQTPQHLRSVLRSLPQSQLRQFVWFITGFTALPAEGAPFTITVNRSGPVTSLPSAHLCSQTLDLPDYNDERLLRDKLVISIGSGAGFGFA